MVQSRTRTIGIAVLATLLLGITVGAGVALADTAPAPADLATRVADLEAYMTNSAPKAMTTTAGPGHNAWMMTSTALVLFMTLPGLALFYGGLVRRKNILSVMAQCFGCAGLVTILWYGIGYSLVQEWDSERNAVLPSDVPAEAPEIPAAAAPQV